MKQLYRNIIFILFLIVSNTIFAQKWVKGKIVTLKDVAPYVQVYNNNTHERVASDDEGNFKIRANINDTLTFTSTLYKKQKIVVDTKIRKEKNLIIQLEEKAYQLKETIIEKKLEFNEKHLAEINEDLKTLAHRDAKNKPYEYVKKEEWLKPTGSSIDFAAVYQLIASVFKKDKKNKNTQTLKFEDLHSLTDTNEILNTDFFVNQLNIKEDRIPAFFDYLEGKEIKVKNLNDQQELFRITDIIIQTAKEFKKL